MKVGDVITVKVRDVGDGYANVEYLGFRGTLMLPEVTWDVTKRPLSVADFVSPAQEIQVKVTAISGDRFSMSMKRALANPWDNAPEVGAICTGVVRVVTEYGYFVMLSKYMEGLLHKDDALSVHAKNDQVAVRVLSCEPERECIRFTELSGSMIDESAT